MMKKLITILILLISINANATHYYVSNAGNDGNAGTSSITSWATLSKVNSTATIGDSVFLNRGDVWNEKLRPGASSIYYGAYGTGSKPIITGLTTITSWGNLGSNIWESTSAVSTLPYTNMVVVNGVNTAMGRTPNAGSTYTYQSHSGTTSITSSDLSGTPDWTGAELAMIMTTYTVARNPITAQSGGTVSYTANARDLGVQQDNQAFIIQNDARTLDVQNEWYFDPSAEKLKMYSTSSPTGVQIATIDTLVYISSHSYITFDNISFQGSNTSTIELLSSPYITIQNCDFNYAGVNAIHGDWGTPANNLTVDNCTFDNSNNDGVTVTQDYNHATATNNTFTHSGVIPFMMRNGGGSAIHLFLGGSNSLIQYNTCDSSGYNGIQWWGSYTTVSNNFVNGYCLNLTDGGGIYSYNAYPDSANTGSKILHNIVINTIASDVGIYNDDHTQGVEVDSNSVANGNYGIYLHNNKNVNVRGNTSYAAANAAILIDNYDVAVTLGNVDIRNNIFFEKNIANPNWTAQFYLINGTIPATFTLDSNYYARPLDDNITIEEHFGGYNDTTLAQWQAYSGQDVHSLKSPKAITTTSDLNFQYNASNSPVNVSLLYAYMNIDGTTNSTGSVTIPAWGSWIGIKNGSVTAATNFFITRGRKVYN